MHCIFILTIAISSAPTKGNYVKLHFLCFTVLTVFCKFHALSSSLRRFLTLYCFEGTQFVDTE